MDNLYEWLPDILLWVTSPIWVGAAAGIFCFYLPVCEHVYTRHSTEIDGELREGSE